MSRHSDEAPTLRHDLAKVKQSYSKIPLSFVANHGQADKRVKFISRGSGYSLALLMFSSYLGGDEGDNASEHSLPAERPPELLPPAFMSPSTETFSILHT